MAFSAPNSIPDFLVYSFIIRTRKRNLIFFNNFFRTLFPALLYFKWHNFNLKNVDQGLECGLLKPQLPKNTLKFQDRAGKGQGLFQPGIHDQNIPALAVGHAFGGMLGNQERCPGQLS